MDIMTRVILVSLRRQVYKNVEFVINQPGLWCDSCGEGIINGLVTLEEIKQVRMKLKLT